MFLGCRSATLAIFLNSGTGLIRGGAGRRGDLGLLAKPPSRLATAEEGPLSHADP